MLVAASVLASRPWSPLHGACEEPKKAVRVVCGAGGRREEADGQRRGRERTAERAHREDENAGPSELTGRWWFVKEREDSEREDEIVWWRKKIQESEKN